MNSDLVQRVRLLVIIAVAGELSSEQAARAIIPLVLEHAAKVAEFHRERWAAANDFEGQAVGARVIAAAIRAEVQHDAG